ncbi:MAG: ribosome biogenesis GTPase Der [Planctomycetales bacterium]|nr:ribosome biogenesis GTPase Der [bacterium]UNM09382.1 MAG: ribosome biogenesis GTPase Der [Planctomycetales bacterium]
MGTDVQRPKVALIGRPNVGKSTLFNRLVGQKLAITDDVPGITRDRLYGVCEWDGYEFEVIDCGGLGEESEDPLWMAVAENTLRAMDEADVIILMADARTGMTLSDDEVLKELRKRSEKPVIVAVNKVEHENHEILASEFWKLGYKDMVSISALSRRRLGEMLDLVVAKLDWSKWPEATPQFMQQRYGDAPDEEEQKELVRAELEEQGIELDEEDYPFAWVQRSGPLFVPDESWKNEPVRLAFVGRQNVGKSSITNALLGRHRALVSDLAGTTRDPLYAEFEFEGTKYELMDTAGMKRITRLKEDVDYYSMIRAEKSLRTSEVGILTLDAEVGVTEQDKRVAQKIADFSRAIVILVNKRDLIPEGKEALELYSDYVRRNLRKLPWAEVVYTCALEGQVSGLPELLAAANRARDNFHRRIDNNALATVLEETVALNPPPIVKNRELLFFDFRQIGNCPPAFLVELNDKMLIRQAYRRFIENTIRRNFDFRGTHIHMVYYQKLSKRARLARASKSRR